MPAYMFQEVHRRWQIAELVQEWEDPYRVLIVQAFEPSIANWGNYLDFTRQIAVIHYPVLITNRLESPD